MDYKDFMSNIEAAEENVKYPSTYQGIMLAKNKGKEEEKQN